MALENGLARDYVIRRVNKESFCRITPRTAEQTFAVHALPNPDVKPVTISGTAGAGKTLLALAAALDSRSKYRQILLTRPLGRPPGWIGVLGKICKTSVRKPKKCW